MSSLASLVHEVVCEYLFLLITGFIEPEYLSFPRFGLFIVSILKNGFEFDIYLV